jgi:putative Mg2+ transporter-C (MgtC) family protein
MIIPNTEIIIRLLIAALLGSIVGFERERTAQSAGLRTHMLVCVGSCLVIIVSAFGFSDALTMPNIQLDPSRMAAQVVSGIGFLGAGAILLRGEVVRGLTTAASVWTVAAIGLAVGGGLYIPAAAATVIVLIILTLVKLLEERYKDKKFNCILNLQVKRGSGNIELIKETIEKKTSRIKRLIVQPSALKGHDDVEIALSRVFAKDVPEIMDSLKQLPFVTDLKEGTND